jgi:hypothetical protein
MELRRITRPGGHVLFTAHTEASVKAFATDFWPPWLPRDTDVESLSSHDMAIIRGRSWDDTYPFFSEAWLRKEAGRYFEVVDLRPAAVPWAQTAFVLRKRP